LRFHKRRRSVSGAIRSQNVARVDAAGAAMGGIGLLAFAFTVYKTVVRYPAVEVLGAAVLIWMAVCVPVWRTRQLI